MDSSVDSAPDDKAAVNGSDNVDAFKTNGLATGALATDSLDISPSNISPPEPSRDDSTTLAAPEGSAALESTANITSDPPADAAENTSTSNPQPTTESSMDAPTNTTAITAVPPVIEAQQSDLREDVVPVSQEQAAQLQSDKHELDVKADSLLAPDSIAPAGNAGSVQAPSSDLHPASDASDAASRDEPSLVPVPQDEPLHPASVSQIDLNAGSQPEPAAALPSSEHQPDTPMLDAPASPAKMAREREDDEMEDGPAAKRTKTELDGPSTPAATPAAPFNGVSATASANKQKMTPNQYGVLLKAVRGQKQSRAGMNFRAPVIVSYPGLAEAYLARISHPIDLSIIEQKVKTSQYEYIEDFKADVELMVNNCVTFNGPNHDITKAGYAVRDNLFAKIPAPTFSDSSKDKKAKRSTPSGDGGSRGSSAARKPPRAPSHPAAPPPVAPAPTFALDPSGVPLIRRDSTKNDAGRPKREIHPPKSKDLVYAVKPKKKKYAVELRFCEEVLAELRKPRYAGVVWPFLEPVDPVALNIPTYFSIIKQPMDLQTIEKKLQAGEYEQAKDFESDFRLMLANCFKFNPVDNGVHALGKELEGIFNDEWKKKGQWVADHTPVSTAVSPGALSDSDEESEEDEAEEDVPSNSTSTQATRRLIEEQNKLIRMMSEKKPDPQLIKMQQDMVAVVQNMVDQESQNLAKKNKKKVSKNPKKANPAKKKSESKKQTPKHRFIGTTEKEIISNGISTFNEVQMDQAFLLIKRDMPQLEVSSIPSLKLRNRVLTNIATAGRLRDRA